MNTYISVLQIYLAPKFLGVFMYTKKDDIRLLS